MRAKKRKRVENREGMNRESNVIIETNKEVTDGGEEKRRRREVNGDKE